MIPLRKCLLASVKDVKVLIAMLANRGIHEMRFYAWALIQNF